MTSPPKTTFKLLMKGYLQTQENSKHYEGNLRKSALTQQNDFTTLLGGHRSWYYNKPKSTTLTICLKKRFCLYRSVQQCQHTPRSVVSYTIIVLKHLLENHNHTPTYNSECSTVNGFAETTLQLCVDVGFVIQAHWTTPTLKEQLTKDNLTKQGRGYKVIR